MHPFPSRRVAAAAVAVSLCIVSASLLAAEPRQPEVVVTATRTPVEADAALAHVSVITREDIERRAAHDIVSLLQAEAGIDVVRGGGHGQQASVFMRGSASNHVLVLVDGVRVSSVNTGGYAWEHLPLAHVERIEIVRGPRAALYGSDAIGGVVQVFTRRPDGPEAALALGNHDTAALDAGFGAQGDDGRFGLRAGYADSGGINAQTPAGFAFDPDDDGYRARTLSLDAERFFGDQVLSFNALASDSDVEFDIGETGVRSHGLSAAYAGALADAWTHRIVAGAHRETLETPAFGSRLDSRREQLDWQHVLQPGDSGQLVLGLAYLREHGESTSTFDGSRVFGQRRDNRAGYAAWRDLRGAHDYELALRHDDSSVFGGETTGQLAWGWQAGAHTRLLASHGQGFRAPNFNELYSPGFGGLFAGNPALEPERARSSELGLRHEHAGTGAWTLHLFRTDIRDLIDFSGPDFQAVNIARARIDGAELGWQRRFGAWSWSANATWQDAHDRHSGTALLRRPSRKANTALSRQFEHGAQLTLEAHAAGPRPELGGDLPGYAVFDAALRWPLAAGLHLEARIDNLLDRDYALVRGFNTPGRTALLRLRWDPR